MVFSWRLTSEVFLYQDVRVSNVTSLGDLMAYAFDKDQPNILYSGCKKR